jgi:hypothetical protein
MRSTKIKMVYQYKFTMHVLLSLKITNKQIGGDVSQAPLMWVLIAFTIFAVVYTAMTGQN